MNRNYPSISVVIPTLNSGGLLANCLDSIISQKYPKSKIEIIIADNGSQDNTHEVAKKYGARVVIVSGKPPQVCQQRNIGAQKSSGDWLVFLDHDMVLSQNLFKNFAALVNKKPSVDAWYIPEKIVTGSKILTILRNFERQFYNGTSIDAVRIIKKISFLKTESMYDPSLSNGPADWDLDIQLKNINCKFDTIKKPLYHHEERFGLLSYILKKGNWIGGIDKYKKKWQKKYHGKYRWIIEEQFGLRYRIFTVFMERGKWKKTTTHPILYLGVLSIKLAMLLLSLVKYKK